MPGESDFIFTVRGGALEIRFSHAFPRSRHNATCLGTVNSNFRKNRMGHGDLKEMLQAALEGVEDRPGAGTPRVVASRQAICDELRAFGEDEVAGRVARLPRGTLTSIFDLAGEIERSGDSRSAGQSLCMAAVAIVEGKPRPFARQRRRRATAPILAAGAASRRGSRTRDREGTR